MPSCMGQHHYDNDFLYGIKPFREHLLEWGRTITKRHFYMGQDHHSSTFLYGLLYGVGPLRESILIWVSIITGRLLTGRTNTKTLSHTGWHKYENTLYLVRPLRECLLIEGQDQYGNIFLYWVGRLQERLLVWGRTITGTHSYTGQDLIGSPYYTGQQLPDRLLIWGSTVTKTHS